MINEWIADLNLHIREALNILDNVTYIDAFDFFIKDGETNMDLFRDGLHPNNDGYEILTNLLMNVLMSE